jgi:hypothetical protein
MPEQPKRDDGKGDESGTAPKEVVHCGPESPDTKRFNPFSFDGLVHVSKVTAAAITVVATIAGLFWGLDWLIGRKLSSPDVLHKIAEYSRPSLIFNAKEHVVADSGALPYIDPKDIKVTRLTDAGLPGHIHIGFVRACRTPPILTPILDVVEIRTASGKGLDWEFDLDWSQWRPGKPDADIHFRLEIVP